MFLTLMIEGANQIVMGDPHEGARLLQDAIVMAERMGNERYVSSALNMLGSGAGEARLYNVALPTLDRAVVLDLKLDADAILTYARDRKSTRLNSSHVKISYAVF